MTFWGGGGADSKLLMLSPKILKSQIPISGGRAGVNFELLMLSPNLLFLQGVLLKKFWGKKVPGMSFGH